MNTETGQLYYSSVPEDMEAKFEALKRGEPVVPVSQQVAEIVEAGHRVLNRAERRRIARDTQREARRRAKGVQR